MPEKLTSRDVNAKVAVEAIRGNMTNNEIMERFKISPRGFADLLKQLFEKRLISEADITRRGIKFRVIKAEADVEPPSEPAPVQSPRMATPPANARPASMPKSGLSAEQEEEFLDTVELTKLFSAFGPTEQPVLRQPARPSEEAEKESEEEAEETNDKKSKFSISGFFKRGR